MGERKILLFIFFVIFYCLYNVNMWFMTNNMNEVKTTAAGSNEETVPGVKSNNIQAKVVKTKPFPLFIKDSCNALEVFTRKPLPLAKKPKARVMYSEDNTITVIGITVFLVVLVLNALLDILKVKEEEKARLKLNPNGERRQSLAEFANKKVLRRESSKFGIQLFPLAESTVSSDEETKRRKESRPYMRGESINSYLSEKTNKSDNSAPASIGETSTDIKHAKRQSVAKLIGARPAPMVRRSSFPVLPMNPEIHALMMSGRQSSIDSDEESDGKGKRVRIIRRF
ncbi:hypothetical protein KGM_204943 [Danaus plexippus plexippus]|uniref:Uncharacterized protein n=1 Tax=Danaus plexippus plexippus TaxID=278856 RepID=A0A212FID7_DANPL|nr:uncharacterized protein LOC116770383 isoform X1 [Danaus plexippus plexippus]OWR53496.1 hypothetical protein KGM_204943 [Danaus plexippus plexippus]